jgi:hypothetical protein
MRDGHEGAARSCTLVFAHVVGARVAGVSSCVHVVCVCAAAGMRPEATRWAPTQPRAAEQAAAWRYLMRVHIKNIIWIFSSSQDSYSRDRHRVQHGNT